jgi:phospholipid/cholesterol/gamma-HCH transport system substrate-binding protein
MKISNEVKVGATALVTLIVFIWLYSFLKGKDIFQSEARYYAIYDKVGGLTESNPVEVNGFKVGVVQSVKFLDATSGKLLVVFSVTKNIKLPVNTVAEIVPVSPLGGMKVQFIYGKGTGFYNAGDTIYGRVAPTIFDIINEDILPLKDKISNLIVTLDSVTLGLNEMMDDKFKSNIVETIDNLNETSGSLKRIVSSEEAELKNTMENINRFSRMLAENSEKLDNTFSNLDRITDTLAAADIYETVFYLKESLEKASLTLDNLNSGKGSAGKLMTDDSLYINLSNSLESLNALLIDMKTNPKKYVHFSIFGKK